MDYAEGSIKGQGEKNLEAALLKTAEKARRDLQNAMQPVVPVVGSVNSFSAQLIRD